MAIKKDAYYFAHDSNARNDEKILCLIADFGLEGYGIFWMLIEMMHESADGTLSHKMIKGLAFKFGVNEGLLQSFVSNCIELGLFMTDVEKYWSERVKRNKEDKEKKYEALSNKRSEIGKKGADKRWNKDIDNQSFNGKRMANVWQTDGKPDFANGKQMANDGQKKEKESKVKEIKRLFNTNIFLTDEERENLDNKLGKDKAEKCINFLSDYKNEKGYKTKSDYLTILRWVHDAVDKSPVQSDKTNYKQAIPQDQNQW